MNGRRSQVTTGLQRNDLAMDSSWIHRSSSLVHKIKVCDERRREILRNLPRLRGLWVLLTLLWCVRSAKRFFSTEKRSDTIGRYAAIPPSRGTRSNGMDFAILVKGI